MRRGILATREELKSLSGRVGRKPFDAIYESLQRRCSLILEAAPVTEAQWRASWQRGAWGSALVAARTTQGRILDLLIAHHIQANVAFRDRAVEELKNVISWSTWVDPCHSDLPADLCTAEAAVAAVVGLDWLWEDLSSPDRLRVERAVRDKAIAPYCQGAANNASWYNTYSNWNPVVNGGCGLAALAMGDELPAAENAWQLAKAGLDKFFAALGREGGWDEGTGYWGFAMRYLLLFGEALDRLMDDQSVFHQRGMDATGLFPVYFSPNGHAASFGDNPSVPLNGTNYLFTRHFGVRDLTWWLDTYSFHSDVSNSGWSTAGLALLFRPVDAEPVAAPDLQPVKVFHQVGWAAVADQWPRPGMYVAAKTGDLSASHSHHDMNSIQVQVAGEMLLVDLGHPAYSEKYFSQDRGEFYEVQARAHNTAIVADADQLITAQGSVLDAQSGDNYRWLALDSAGACGEDVSFVRHVVMIVDPGRQLAETLLVVDEMSLTAPEKVDIFWHTAGQVSLNEKARTGVIQGDVAALQCAFGSTGRMRLAAESRRLDTRRQDRFVRISAGLAGATFFVSAFSRLKDMGKLSIEEHLKGLVVGLGAAKATFRQGRRHQVLASVTRGTN
jgi:hypothetical protein